MKIVSKIALGMIISLLPLCPLFFAQVGSYMELVKINGSGICQQCDLRMVPLAGNVLTGDHLEGSDFSGNNLMGTIFIDAHLENANFTNSLFDRNTDFSGAHINSKTILPPTQLAVIPPDKWPHKE